MMRNIAIGLATAAIAIGGSTLTAPPLQAQESGISKGGMSKSVTGHRFGPRAYAYEEEGGRGRISRYQPDRFDGISRYERLSPRERERLGMMMRERYSELTPRERERVRGIMRERYSELTPLQRERLGKFARERYSELTPREREHVRGIM